MKKENPLTEDKVKVIEDLLKPMEEPLDIKFLVEGSIVNQSRDKALKGTKSWCCNTFLRAFHQSGKKKEELPELIRLARELIQNPDIKLEDNGYLTFKDLKREEND